MTTSTSVLIETEYKTRYRNLVADLGRQLRGEDREYIALHEWYKDSVSVPASVVSDETEPNISGGCRDCGKPIEKNPGRGRPPVRCLSCRGM